MIDLLRQPADLSEPHLVLIVHRSLRLPPIIRRLGPGVYHLAVDIRPLLRGRWRQPVAAGLVEAHWMCGTTAEVLAALKEPEPTPELDLEESEPVSAPESDATVDPLLPPAPEPTHESNQDPVTEDEPIVIEDDADETNE